MIWERGKWSITAVYNWPTLSPWSVQRWRYRPEDDARRWFLRWRVGPFKIEVTRWR